MMSGCFNKQEHQVTAPEMPNYQISVQVIDVNDRSPLSGASVIFKGEYLLYDCSEGPFQTETDEQGKTLLTGMCPGFYSITAAVNGVAVQEQRFELKHGDTTVVIQLPSLMKAEFVHSENAASGFAWLSNDTLAFVAQTDLPHMAQPGYRIFTGNFANGFFNTAPFPLAREYPELSGLARIDSNLYSFSGGFDDPVINIIKQYSYRLIEQVAAPHRLRDLAAFDGHLYATTTRQSLVKWPPTDATAVIEVPSPGNHPRGIAAGPAELWTSDEGEFGYPRLYRHSSDMKVNGTFAAVDESNNVLLASYLALSPAGELWALVQAPDGSALFYRLTLE